MGSTKKYARRHAWEAQFQVLRHLPSNIDEYRRKQMGSILKFLPKTFKSPVLELERGQRFLDALPGFRDVEDPYFPMFRKLQNEPR